MAVFEVAHLKNLFFSILFQQLAHVLITLSCPSLHESHHGQGSFSIIVWPHYCVHNGFLVSLFDYIIPTPRILGQFTDFPIVLSIKFRLHLLFFKVLLSISCINLFCHIALVSFVSFAFSLLPPTSFFFFLVSFTCRSLNACHPSVCNIYLKCCCSRHFPYFS